MLGNRIVPTLTAAFAPNSESGAAIDIPPTATNDGPTARDGTDGAAEKATADGGEGVADALARSGGKGRQHGTLRTAEATPGAIEKTFPDTWRQDLAGGDKAFLKTLDRFENPAALAKAYRELTARLSSGDLRAAKPPDANASPEQLATWRAAHGLPETVEAYIAGLELPGGMIAGQAEEPLLASFAEQALKGYWTRDQYNQAVGWYFATQDRLMAQRQLADAQFKGQAASDLMREWGTDYAVNRNAIIQFLDRHFPQGLKIDLLNARLSDGHMLANHPGFNKAILEVAKIVNPSGTVLPNASGAGQAGADNRIAEIERKYMRAAHGSEPWKSYWTGDSGARMQQEYRSLLAAREQTRRGGGA